MSLGLLLQCGAAEVSELLSALLRAGQEAAESNRPPWATGRSGQWAAEGKGLLSERGR